MATDTVAPEMIQGDVIRLVQNAFERLDSAAGELVLDLSPVRRIDTAALRAMSELASRAYEKSVPIVLCGVHAEIYRVLKLVNLAARFSFRT